jgi:hypothetical protein
MMQTWFEDDPAGRHLDQGDTIGRCSNIIAEAERS